MLRTWIWLSSLGLAASVPLASADGLSASTATNARPLDALEMAFTQGSLFGECPETPNACNNTDGCTWLQPRKYTVWLGLTRCTWGLKGCENGSQGLCKLEFNVFPCQRPADLSTGNPVYEAQCP